jgi:hypothetical protein
VDLVDVAILVLRIALVVLLYLFLALVVRSALRSFGAPAAPARERPSPSASSASTSSSRSSSNSGSQPHGRLVEPARHRLVLTVVEPAESGHAAGERIDVWPTNVLGRSAPADVVLGDRAISAQHARFDRRADRWLVTDLESTNGTRVNGRAVRGATRLQSGDALEVGPMRFEVSDTG